MATIKEIKIQNLLLDVDNYRIGHQAGQPQSIKAIIEEQGPKLVNLAKDIIKNGLSPIELLLVTPSPDNPNIYIVIEGSRRVTAIKLINNPTLAAGTELEEDFKKLAIKSHPNLPDIVNCVIVPMKADGKVWIRRRHDRNLKGAGLEEWSSIANDRADADAGKPAPAKDVREFILNNAGLPDEIKKIIAGPKFNNTNLTRLLGTSYIRKQLEIEKGNGTIFSTADQIWVLQILGEILSIIATKKLNGKDWSEADIDQKQQRIDFFDALTDKYPKPSKKVVAWEVNGSQEVKHPKPKSPKTKPTPLLKPTPSSHDRDFVIPKDFTLILPDGKTNNIFHELRRLPLEGKDKFPNAVAVLLRVFIENSITHFIEQKGITLKPKMAKGGLPKTDAKGNVLYEDTLNDKIKIVIGYLETNKLVKHKELDTVKKALATPFSILSVATLNGYVHNPDINPKPIELKLTWDDLKNFICKLWI